VGEERRLFFDVSADFVFEVLRFLTAFMALSEASDSDSDADEEEEGLAERLRFFFLLFECDFDLVRDFDRDLPFFPSSSSSLPLPSSDSSSCTFLRFFFLSPFDRERDPLFFPFLSSSSSLSDSDSDRVDDGDRRLRRFVDFSPFELRLRLRARWSSSSLPRSSPSSAPVFASHSARPNAGS
jgi:hypothetical protein